MKPILINAKQVRELIGMTVETAQYDSTFPKPVNVPTPRRLWRYEEIKKWAESLERRKGCYSY